MDDETVLYLAKNRLQTLRAKSYSLEKLAVRSIVKNVRFYLDSDDQLGQLNTLSAILKEKLLQLLLKQRRIDYNGKTEEFELLMRIFHVLLNSQTRCFQLSGIISFVNPDDWYFQKRYLSQDDAEFATLKKATEWCEQLIQWIGTLAPKIETIIITQNYPHVKVHYPFDRKSQAKPEMLQSILKMQNLKFLHLNLHRFKVTDVYEMCKNLPNLQFMNVQTLKKEYLNIPNDLEFSRTRDSEVAEKIYRKLQWLADKLSVDFPDAEIVPYNHSRVLYNRLNHHLEVFKKWIPRESCQRHIFVDLAENEIGIPYNIRNLSSLTDSFDDRYPNPEADSTPQFEKNRQLSFEFRDRHSDAISLQNDLSTSGQNLQALSLSTISFDCDFQYDLSFVSKCCPRLEKLSLANLWLKTSTLPNEVFPELQELEWTNPFCYDDTDFLNKNNAIILCNILSAPKLEKVVLEGTNYNEADLLRLNSLIQEKKILSQLHTFHFSLNCYDNKRFEILTNILKTACVFLPKLSDFRVTRNRTTVDPLFKYALRKDDKIFDECVRSLLDLFENEK